MVNTRETVASTGRRRPARHRGDALLHLRQRCRRAPAPPSVRLSGPASVSVLTAPPGAAQARAGGWLRRCSRTSA